MRKQDKEMLTSSSRLLHAQLEEFEALMAQRKAAEGGQTQYGMFPSLSKSGLGTEGNQDPGETSRGLTSAHSVKALSRPGSAFVLFGGDRDQLKKAKSRIGIKEARKRDIMSKSRHSY